MVAQFETELAPDTLTPRRNSFIYHTRVKSEFHSIHHALRWVRSHSGTLMDSVASMYIFAVAGQIKVAVLHGGISPRFHSPTSKWPQKPNRKAYSKQSLTIPGYCIHKRQIDLNLLQGLVVLVMNVIEIDLFLNHLPL